MKIEIKPDLFLTGLQLLFIAFKLNGTIDWSWWWVLSPLWIAGCLFVLSIIFVTKILPWWQKDEW